jgi:hypothetical protein
MKENENEKTLIDLRRRKERRRTWIEELLKLGS